ncbi:MAG: SusC/RagA family TonB-linked outer membrane protein [Bacteroidales bacterium]|nr:SusC/RagA family TonB-linked outer membrane protein [Bacteroidales bacterium]
MKRFYHFCLSLLLLTAAIPAMADVVVKGTVTDETGQPVIGGGVVEVGTTNGVVTDVNGTYTISVKGAASVLQFSCIGYETVEMTVGNRGTIDVVMQEATSFLQEAVAIGYGTQKKADITSSVQNVKAEDFNKGAVIDAGQLIQGKVAGLQITVSSGDPTASSSVMLRGTSSLYGSSAPLILVDGIPGSFATVAPEDIETIDVLKDGSATAIYGTRGTNGVIIITTKNAKREMPATVEYSGYVTASTWLKRPDFMTADDLTARRAEGWKFQGANGQLAREIPTDWLSEISRTAISQNHNVSIMGGTKHNTYTANITYNDNQGTIKNTGRSNIRARAMVSQYLLNDKLKLSAEVMANETNSDSRFDAAYAYRQACIQGPLQPIYEEDGSYVTRDIYLYANPMTYLNEQLGMSRSRNVRFNGVAELKPIESLTLKMMYVRKGQNSISGYYNTRKDESTTKSGRNGQAGRGASDYISNMVELSASWVKDFGDHHVTAVGGYSYEDGYSENFSASNWNFPNDGYTWNALQKGKGLKEGTASMSSGKSMSKLIGLFDRATYNYDDRYLLMASIRRDGSSKFGKGMKWGYFPGISAGWRLNNEEFLKDVSWLNNLKLRAGYGVTGIDISSPYQSLASIDYSGNYMYNGEWIQPISPTRNDNPNLHWEKKLEYNVGLDFAVLDERLSGSIDLYRRDTKDGLYYYSVPTPPYYYGSIMANVAQIRNEGIEILLNATPVRTRDFEWNSSLTFSKNRNELLSISNDQFKSENDYFDTGYTGEPIQKTTHQVKVGQPIGNFFNLRSIGLDENGKWVVERLRYDEEGNVVSKYYGLAADAGYTDWQVLGNGVPDIYLNFNNNFRYKNFDLALTMRGAFGFQILNFQKMFYGNPTILYNTLNCAFDQFEAVDARTGEKIGKMVNLSDTQRIVSYYIEDGDYWKIDNVTLGYNLNFKNKKYVKKLRVYGSIHNLATITKYTGLDPEVPVNGFDAGTDERDKYPTIRTYTFGLNITF